MSASSSRHSRRSTTTAGRVLRLYDQGARPAARRPQGQSRRPHDIRPDGDFRAAMRYDRAMNGSQRKACRCRERLRRALSRVPFNAKGTPLFRRPVQVPATLDFSPARTMSTQEGFGKILGEIARREDDLRAAHRDALAGRLGLDQSRPLDQQARAVLAHEVRDTFHDEKVVSAQKWLMSRSGQHVELGIAENNLFIMLAASDCPPRSSASASCRSARSMIPSSRAASIASTMPAIRAPGFSSSRRRPAWPWRRRAAPTSRSARPYRHRAGRPRRLRARLRRRTRSDHGLDVRLHAEGRRGGTRRAQLAARTRQADRSICVYRHGHWSSRLVPSRPISPPTSSTAPIGCAHRDRLARSSSSIRGRSPPKRSRRPGGWPRTGAASRSWR